MAHEMAKIGEVNGAPALGDEDGVQSPHEVGRRINKCAVEVEDKCRRGHENP